MFIFISWGSNFTPRPIVLGLFLRLTITAVPQGASCYHLSAVRARRLPENQPAVSGRPPHHPRRRPLPRGQYILYQVR